MNFDDARLRWLRANVLAVVVFAVGTAAHSSADGLLPGPVGLSVLFMATFVGCWTFLARPAGPWRVVLLTAGGQAGVHVLLTLTAGHHGDQPVVAHSVVPAATSGGSLFDQYAASVPAVAAGDPFGHLAGDLAAHAPMMLAHLAAAVLVGLWLASGERALWTLFAFAACGVSRLVVLFASAVPLPLPVRPAPVQQPALPRPQHAVIARSVVRRGPPVLLTA